MNGDERFDALLRSALASQAEAAVRRTPALHESVRKVAVRLEPARGTGRVHAGGPAAARAVQLAFAALLLLLALAAALAIGSYLVTRPVFEAPRFGFASDCSTPVGGSTVYTVIDDAGVPLVLGADGLLWSMESDLGETRSAMFDGIVGTERRLADRGISLVRERIADALPDGGCRALRSSADTGQISASIDARPVELSWHPQNPGRRLTTEEESAAEALERALLAPEAWLPPDAWVQSGERQTRPDRWLAIVELTPSGVEPGAEVPLSTGVVLDGSDPRYARVVLPEGQSPHEFGAEVTRRDETVVRCGVLGTADAQALATSLDELPLAMHDEEELFTTDLTMRVFIYIATSYPLEPDCERFSEQQSAGPPPTAPSATPRSGDDLATVDPCTLLPESVDGRFPGRPSREVGPATVSIGAPARSCRLSTREGDNIIPTYRVGLTLYPRSVDPATAETLAGAVLGGGLVEEPVSTGRLWLNDCFAGSAECRRIAAAWSEPYFVVIEFGGGFVPDDAGVPPATARSVVEEVVVDLGR